MDKKISYKISNNNDWADMKKGENLVDVSNDSYFAFRAMQKAAKSIIYNPSLINNMVRIAKESKKFPDTKHILIIDQKTLSYSQDENLEDFIKKCSIEIEKILKINNNFSFDVIINTKLSWIKDSNEIIKKIYNL